MHVNSLRFVGPAVVLAAFALLVAKPARAAEESKSAGAVKQLIQMLDTAKLDSIAVADPSSPNSFIAAIYIPETQLLVVSAKYSAPALLVDKIKLGDYRGVYMDLHAAGTSGTRIFVQDMGPDGLMSRSENGDSWEEAGKTTMFDGQWKKSKSSEAEYMKTFTDADERYAKMLLLLEAQAKQVKKIGS
ncbi:MAG: hypothetical protein V7647_1765 [Acidobacteriota bacterium]|jgi:hypothetical protein